LFELFAGVRTKADTIYYTDLKRIGLTEEDVIAIEDMVVAISRLNDDTKRWRDIENRGVPVISKLSKIMKEYKSTIDKLDKISDSDLEMIKNRDYIPR
jgi:hypothetical protein